MPKFFCPSCSRELPATVDPLTCLQYCYNCGSFCMTRIYNCETCKYRLSCLIYPKAGEVPATK